MVYEVKIIEVDGTESTLIVDKMILKDFIERLWDNMEDERFVRVEIDSLKKVVAK